MKKQPTAEKKKKIQFQFGLRKRMRTDLIVVGSLLAVSFLLAPYIGMPNALSCAMGVITVFISTRNDFTLEPVKNLCILTAGIIGVVFAAFLGYAFFPAGTVGYTVMMTLVTFVTFFAVIYLFTSEEKGHFYMPLLLNFSTMVYTPVYGLELLLRVAIFFAYIIVIILFQLALYRNKLRRQIHKDLEHVIALSKTQISAILTREPKPHLTQRSQEIEQNLLAIMRTIGPKLARLTRWQAGHDVMRTTHILRRINIAITETYIEGNVVLTREFYHLFEDLFRAIDQFEKDEISEEVVIRKFDLLFGRLDESIHTDAANILQTKTYDYVSGEMEQMGQVTSKSIRERIFEKINFYNLIFAVKTASVAALGVLITCLLQIENANMYIMTIAVLAQPYVEVGSQKVRLRIINTIFALAIFLIAFSLPGGLWLHMLVLMALILIGDMFFQFETNVIGSTMLAVISKAATDPSQMLSISLYRFSYVAIAGIVLLLVDTLFFPKRLTASLGKQISHSLEINKQLRSILVSADCSVAAIDRIVLEKRRANQKIVHINQFVQHPDVTAFLLADEAWLNQLTLVNHRLQLSAIPPDRFRTFFINDGNQQNNLPPTDLRQRNILYSLHNVLAESLHAEQIVESVSFSK